MGTPTAKAKAPPPELMEKEEQSFPNLSDWLSTPSSFEENGTPQAQSVTGNSALPAQENSEPCHSKANGNSLIPSQGPPRPVSAESQGTPQTASKALPKALNPRSVSPWATMSAAPNPPSRAPSTQHFSGDYRLLPDGTQRPQPIRVPRINMWASKKFDQDMYTELDFLKVWLHALQDHDFGSQRVWREYCEKRSDGTYDPRKHLPGFTRKFLFVYGSQPRDFFTQHQAAGLLSEEQENDLLRQSTQAYRATHWHNSPPHRSTHWPPQPVPDLTTLLATPATQQREAPTDRRIAEQSNTAHWQPHHTPPAGWPQSKATSVHTSAWYSKANSAYPTWQYTAQWHPWQSHWSASWDWHGDAWWSGGWRWP